MHSLNSSPLNSRGTRMHAHIATKPLSVRTLLDRAVWHPDRAEWALNWELVLHLRRKWMEYYLAQIRGESRIMREEISSFKEVAVRQYTEKEVNILGGYDWEEEKLMPRYSLMRDDKRIAADRVDTWRGVAQRIFEYEGRGERMGSVSEREWVRRLQVRRRGNADKGEAVIQMLIKNDRNNF